jgi:hypothetical protein
VAFSVGEAEEAQLAGRVIPGYFVVQNDPTSLPELLDINSILTLGIDGPMSAFEPLESSCSWTWTSPTSTEPPPASRRKITSRLSNH